MNRQFSKVEIINHSDSLINRIDIDIEESIGKYDKEKVISELKCFEIGQRHGVKSQKRFSYKSFDSTKSDIKQSMNGQNR